MRCDFALHCRKWQSLRCASLDEGVVMQRYHLIMPMLLGLCFVANPPASAAPTRTLTPFDGKYTGSLNLAASGLSTRDSNGSDCVEGRPATMMIRNGAVYIQYADWQ